MSVARPAILAAVALSALGAITAQAACEAPAALECGELEASGVTFC